MPFILVDDVDKLDEASVVLIHQLVVQHAGRVA